MLNFGSRITFTVGDDKRMTIEEEAGWVAREMTDPGSIVAITP